MSSTHDGYDWEPLFAFTAPWLEEKLLRDCVFASTEEYSKAFHELKKYFVLTATHGKHLAMISQDVDRVWHQFILFTIYYQSFCMRFFGRFIHHMPVTTHTPLGGGGIHEFIDAYQSTFGELPSIWGGDRRDSDRREPVGETNTVTDSDAGCTNEGCGQCAGCRAPLDSEALALANCSGCSGCEGTACTGA